jgi:hypothetical protein
MTPSAGLDLRALIATRVEGGEDAVLILDRTQITGLLDLDELIDFLAGTMVDLSEGRTPVLPRSAAQVPDCGVTERTPTPVRWDWGSSSPQVHSQVAGGLVPRAVGEYLASIHRP